MLALYTFVFVCLSSTCYMTQARAATQVVNPSQLIVSSGSANSTDLAYMSEKDGLLIAASSNKSGDRNYYESYKIEKKDHFLSYFTLRDTYTSTLMVDVKEEKVAADGKSHKNVIRFQDDRLYTYNNTDVWYNQVANQKSPVADASVNKTTGFLEFYFLSESKNGTFMVCFGEHAFRRYIENSYFKGISYGINFGIAPIVNSTNSSFFYSTSWLDDHHVIQNVSYIPNKWYHVRLSFLYNASWSILIDNKTVHDSGNWTMNPALTKFDSVSMFTSTRTKASCRSDHVFYMDALGLSYNVTAHNLASAMDFNEGYEEYVDVYSINNINDHVVTASLELYILFELGNLTKNINSYLLQIKGYFSNTVNSSKLLFLHRAFGVYETFKDYRIIVPGYISNFTFGNSQNATVNQVNASRYVGTQGRFAMKIEAESSNNFEYNVDYIGFEISPSLWSDAFGIIVFSIIGAIFIGVILKITHKGGFGRSASRRNGAAGRRV